MFEYIAPQFKKSAFNCPLCGAYAQMKWSRLTYIMGKQFHSPIWICLCTYCKDQIFWFQTKSTEDSGYNAGHMLIPNSGAAPLPHPDMPEYIKEDYNEAREVVGTSPRSAAALLRLSIQKLCIELGEKGKKVNDDIASLVRQGLPVQVQKALDVVRVVGNHAVHPGELQKDDIAEVAFSLFEITNQIVEDMISRPKKLQELYDGLPEGAKEGIKQRDGTNSTIPRK